MATRKSKSAEPSPRDRRIAAGLSRALLAEALGWSRFRLDKFERAEEHDAADLKAYDAALKATTKTSSAASD